MMTSILLEVILAEREKLPNIVGFTDWWSGGGGTSSSNMGAFYNALPKQSSKYVGTASGEMQLLGFDASLTTGTGAGVYKNNAHVQPNSVTLCYWQRLQ